MSITQPRITTTSLFDSFSSVPSGNRPVARRRTNRALDVDRRWLADDIVGALAGRYPVVRRMVGAESFQAAAHRYVAERFPMRLDDRDTFPSFLRGLARDASFAYLADIAELELALAKARRAPTVSPIATRTLAWSAEPIGSTRLALHPSVSLIASRFPVVTIWEANQSDDCDGMVGRWSAEAALVARPWLDVKVRRLPTDGGHAFVEAVRDGFTIAEATAAASAAWPAFDLSANLAMLAETGVVVAIAPDI